MAPKSAAALVLLAAMIAGLAPPLQAQQDERARDMFTFLVEEALCSSDDAMQKCASQLVESEGAISSDCCRDLLKAVTSGEGTSGEGTSGEGKGCACGIVNEAAASLGIDVDQRCQAASNGGVARGPPTSKLKELCKGAPGN